MRIWTWLLINKKNTRGLGLEMSRALAESGANVAIMFVSSEKTHDTAAQIAKDYNVTCKAYKADIVDPVAVKEAVDQIYKDFGAIDVFVANAGVSIGGKTEVRAFCSCAWRHRYSHLS